jgi:acetyl-CoA C-acetyltransferase
MAAKKRLTAKTVALPACGERSEPKASGEGYTLTIDLDPSPQPSPARGEGAHCRRRDIVLKGEVAPYGSPCAGTTESEAMLSRLTRRNIRRLPRPSRQAKKLGEKETPAERNLSIKGKAYIAGIYEHPTRHAPDKSTAQLHAEIAKGAIEDAGLTKADIDGYFCAGDAPGGVMAMVDYLGLKVRHFDSTDTGGCSYLVHLGHAAEAIAAGKCSIALVTLAGKPRTGPMPPRASGAEADFEAAYGATTHNIYGMCALRHMHEFGTTSEQLAWIKVAASHHAQYNPHAMLPDVVTVEDVLNSPMIADPLHRMDCCVVTDGGGGFIVTSEAIAKTLKKPLVRMIGHGEALKGPRGGQKLDLTYSAGVWSGPRAFEEAGVTPKDIKYASIYDSFTITVLMQLEDLGFCKKGEGGKFVADGNLISGVGKLPFNTDGGGLCSNHPVNRGGMTKILETVRQLRGEAHPKVQVPNCDLAIAHGTGGLLGVRHAASTCILERV